MNELIILQKRIGDIERSCDEMYWKIIQFYLTAVPFLKIITQLHRI